MSPNVRFQRAGGVAATIAAAAFCFVSAAPSAPAQTPAAQHAVQNQSHSGANHSMVMTAADMTAWPILRRAGADSAPAVRSLQYLLNAHGWNLAVDGNLGTRTAAAVRSFQQSHGLVADGVVGQRTWSALIVIVRSGSTGPAVKAVQEQINARLRKGRNRPLAVDGSFGTLTQMWVRGFQSALADDIIGFRVDGIVGPMTWRALIAGEFPNDMHCS